jgi:hypothetical protein
MCPAYLVYETQPAVFSKDDMKIVGLYEHHFLYFFMFLYVIVLEIYFLRVNILSI